MTMTAKQYLAKQKELAQLRKAMYKLEEELSVAQTALRAKINFERRETGTVILRKNAGTGKEVRATFTPNRRGRYSLKVDGVVLTTDYCGTINEYRLAMALGKV